MDRREGEGQMVIAVAPFRDEARFAEAWAKNVSRYADRVVVIDTGSEDKTATIIGHTIPLRIPCDVLDAPRAVIPYLWREGHVRQQLLDACPPDSWVIKHDMDELVPDSFIDWTRTFLPYTKHDLFKFPRLAFWGSPHIVRVNQPGDRHWGPVLKVWRNRRVFYDQNEGNHAREWLRKGVPASLFARYMDIPFFHLHYLDLSHRKANDNRTPDFDRSGLRCETYHGEYPREMGL